MSWTTNSGDHGSVVTVNRVVDDDTVGVITLPPGELFSETKDNSVAILLTYGPACILLAGDAEKGEEEYMASG